MSKPKVGFNKENIDKCICPDCPVQGECMEEARAKLKVKKEKGVKPEPKDLKPIGMYCAQAVGTTSCDDLDEDKGCICPSCPLWSENDLQETYYCFKEEADRTK